MAAVCDICGKKPFFGKQVSQRHIRGPTPVMTGDQNVTCLRQDLDMLEEFGGAHPFPKIAES